MGIDYIEYDYNAVNALITENNIEGLKRAKQIIEEVVNQYRDDTINIIEENEEKYKTLLRNQELFLKYINDAIEKLLPENN